MRDATSTGAGAQSAKPAKPARPRLHPRRVAAHARRPRAHLVGLELALSFGDPGGLASTLGFTGALLASWAPSEKGYDVAVGLRLPGLEAGASRSTIMGPLNLSIGRLTFLYDTATSGYLLTLQNIALSFLGLSFPPGGKTNAVLFGDPDRRGEQRARLVRGIQEGRGEEGQRQSPGAAMASMTFQFLDVGQGDGTAVVMRSSNNLEARARSRSSTSARSALPRRSPPRTRSSTWSASSTATATAPPAVQPRSSTSLFLTHPDADHYNKVYRARQQSLSTASRASS